MTYKINYKHKSTHGVSSLKINFSELFQIISLVKLRTIICYIVDPYNNIKHLKW